MSEEFNEINCPSCGIYFGFTKKVEKLWRESHKNFFCPNGHTMSWRPSDKDDLNKKINDLENKLILTKKELEAANKKIEELTIELEIWKPATTT